MTRATAMVVGTVASLAAILAVAGTTWWREAALGLAGPLVAVTASWVAIERAHGRGAAQVLPVMIRAFVWKVVFFGAYVAVVLKLGRVAPIPFVVSFTGYFVTLYVVQAVLLQRLVTRGAGVAPSSSSS